MQSHGQSSKITRATFLRGALAAAVAAPLAGCSSAKASSGSGSTGPVELTWYYPVNVGGAITKTIQSLADQYKKENPNVTVTPVYTGDYDETRTKIQAAVKAKKVPDLAIALSAELFLLNDLGAIDPLDSYINADSDGKAYIDNFYAPFLANSQTGGKTWSIPFQRSTVVMYYNKDLFKKAGLDPEKPPQTWEELRQDAKQLTVANQQWGVEVPSTIGCYWLLQAFDLENGDNIMNSDGTKVYFDRPDNVEALQFVTDLSRVDKVMPTGTIDWKTSPTDFINQKTAMLYHTTGNLTSIKQNAKFDFGVAFLPKNKHYGTPTGGGNFYIFKNSPQDHKEQSWKFIRWVTAPGRAAQWSIETGYVAPSRTAYDTSVMKDYVSGFPQAAVARDQLQYASAELSTHNNGQVQQTLSDAMQAAVTGSKTPAQALNDAQSQADSYLMPFNK